MVSYTLDALHIGFHLFLTTVFGIQLRWPPQGRELRLLKTRELPKDRARRHRAKTRPVLWPYQGAAGFLPSLPPSSPSAFIQQVFLKRMGEGGWWDSEVKEGWPYT